MHTMSHLPMPQVFNSIIAGYYFNSLFFATGKVNLPAFIKKTFYIK